jgi:hypothetical protein|tara:strand:- start:1198 stop:1374 length:177 start_codon:yes stop_codon:yes gene_type:complete
VKITAYEKERLKHINFIMDELYDKLDNIYEHMVDRENKSVLTQIESLQKTLEDIKESI